MPKRDWREKATRAYMLGEGIYYRSPLWRDDHLLARNEDMKEEGLAWCGRPLQQAMDGWGDPQLEGIWITNRKAAHCSNCERRDKEYLEALELEKRGSRR